MKKFIIIFFIASSLAIGIIIYGIIPRISGAYVSTYSGDVIEMRETTPGIYVINIRGGKSIWANKSFREGSLGGGYRGVGPHAGK